MIYRLFLFCSCLLIIGCTDFSEANSIDIEEQEKSIAIPIINSNLSIADFTQDENTPDNFSIKIDENDGVTLVYQGAVVRQEKSDIFPVFPLFPVPLFDTVSTVPVPFATDQNVDLAIFDATIMNFRFTSSFTEDITVTVEVDQLVKDGETFTIDFDIPYSGNSTTEFISDTISIEDWVLTGEDNVIVLKYFATLADGSRNKLDVASVIFTNIEFKYIEGYFGADVFDISGDFVPIGVLDNWRSGGLSFEDPKVNIFVDNAFGFPVRSIFNTMQVVTTTDEILDMESNIINNNIDFAYPSLEEVGQSKITEFSFNKDNSNIVELFEERVSRVIYDIDAGANPDMDESITGYVDDESYFEVSVDVELPLNGSILNLELQDTFDLDLANIETADEVEFKIIVGNGFPANISFQTYIFDDQKNIVDSLFSDRLNVDSGLLSNGIVTEAIETITFETFTGDRLEALKQGKRALVNVIIDTQSVDESPLWILNSYGVDFRIGAIVKTRL